MKGAHEHLSPAPVEFFGGGHDAYEIKFGSIAKRISRWEELQGFRAAIVGFPIDDGVRRNHGRIGAAQGPNAIRRTFYRLNAMDAFRNSIANGFLADVGNIVPGKDVEESQARLGAVVAKLLGQGIVPLVLGGGHETAWGHLRGHLEDSSPLTVFNVDPHLDVRESPGGQATSGNPFRLALEHAGSRLRYVCIGARPAANAPNYADWVLERGGTIYWESPGAAMVASEALAREFASDSNPRAVVSLDVDAVSSAFAPGSSAASPLGIVAADFVGCAGAAGANAKVTALEISELSPPLDRDFQTERLCALALQEFLLNFVRR